MNYRLMLFVLMFFVPNSVLFAQQKETKLTEKSSVVCVKSFCNNPQLSRAISSFFDVSLIGSGVVLELLSISFLTGSKRDAQLVGLVCALGGSTAIFRGAKDLCHRYWYTEENNKSMEQK